MIANLYSLVLQALMLPAKRPGSASDCYAKITREKVLQGTVYFSILYRSKIYTHIHICLSLISSNGDACCCGSLAIF